MGKLIADKTQAETQQPIVLNPTTVNTYLDDDVIGEKELATANNIIFENKMIEKIGGTYRVYNISAATPVYGLHRAYSPDAQQYTIYLCNGNLKVTTDFSSPTTVLTGCASLYTPFVNVRGRAYGINTTDGVIRYNPKMTTLATPTNAASAIKTGINCPLQRKVLAFFESNETWSQDAGTVAKDYGIYRADEWSGNAITSLKLTAAASLSAQGSMTYASAQDLTTFGTVNGVSETSTTDDMITFYTYHDNRPNISYIQVIFYNTAGTGNYYCQLYKDDFASGNYQWTEWKVAKNSFIAYGSGYDWADVKSVSIRVFASSSGSINMWFDMMHMQTQKIKIFNLRVPIASCNYGESWSPASFDNSAYKEGNCSYKFSAAGTATVTGLSVNLANWPDGSTISASDEVCLWTVHADYSDVTSLQVRLGTAVGVYYAHTIAQASFNSGDQVVTEHRIKKSNFSAVGGISSWASITRCDLVLAMSVADNFWVDDIRLELYNPYKEIAMMEVGTETWVGSVANKISLEGHSRAVVQGSTCLRLWPNTTGSFGDISGTYDCATTNLTQWADGSESMDSDVIAFYVYWENSEHIDKLTLYLDCNAADFATDYFKYEVPQTKMPAQDYQGVWVIVPKEDFTRVGSTSGKTWATIESVRFTVSSRDIGYIYMDALHMKRRSGITGQYYYKYCYVINDIRSAFSDTSDLLDARNTNVKLTNIKAANDTRVKAREIYRLGGAYPDTWKLVKTLPDNTTTSFIDDVSDSQLGFAAGEEIPSGIINKIACKNLIYDPENDRMLYWGDPSFENRIYYSNKGFYHVVNETSYREMPYKVMYVHPFFGINIVFFRHTVKKITGDVASADIEDLPITDGSCSLYGVTKGPGNTLLYAGCDNAYLFDGYRSNPIGNEVKNYFRDNEANTDDVRMAYHKDSLYLALDDGTLSYNHIVLRRNFIGGGWSIIPNWNVNAWTEYNQGTDTNELYYADSVNGSVYYIDYSTAQFSGSTITSTIETGWLQYPDSDIRVTEIEITAKASAASGTIAFTGYVNHSTSAAVVNGTLPSSGALTTAWQTFVLRFAPSTVLFQGDSAKIRFVNSTNSVFVYMKNIVIKTERLPKQLTSKEVTIS